jgi:hypothetical protein
MRGSSSILIETSRVTREDLANFLEVLRDCWKCSSLLWMQSNEFPVLAGLILSGHEQGTEEIVSRFCQERSFSELLVRIEKPGQRWTRRRAGYTIPLSEVRGLIDTNTREGMLTLLLEPASPYADLYSVTSVCDLPMGRIDVEVVGPGFDASDILRSDTTPHERFEVSFDLEAIRSGEAREPKIRRSHLVEQNAYRACAQRRLTKIGARLRNPPFPDEVLQAASKSFSEQLAQDAVQYLRRTGNTLLLDHLDEYEPIPRALLESFLSQLQRLLLATSQSQVPWRALSVAASFLEDGDLVLWDFFAPDSYDTRILSSFSAAPSSD